MAKKRKKIGLNIKNVDKIVEMFTCPHDRAEIKWEKRPRLEEGSNGDILWYGRCACGKLVYEIYQQQDEVYEANE